MEAVMSDSGDGTAKPKKQSKKMAIIIAAPLALVSLIAALWFCNIIPSPFASAKPASLPSPDKSAKVAAHPVPIFIEVPEMVANLNAPGRRPAYVKLKAQIELPKAEDRAVFAAAQAHIIDLFQTYIRDMHPEELRGSAGTYRLRSELIARVNIAIAPERVTDVLFSELLVQ